MKRVTKQLAENIARSVLAKKADQLNDARNLAESTTTQFVLETFPKVVQDAFNKHPEYFGGQRWVFIDCPGFNREYINLSIDLPIPDNDTVKLPVEKGDIILELVEKYNILRKEFNELKSQIKTAIFGLATYAAVRREFPEAAEFLPDETTTALTVNLNDIRKKL